MYLAGFISLLIALLIAVWGGCLALLMLWEKRATSLKLVRLLSWPLCAAFLFASATLLHALYWQDYSLEYVASYTDKYLPLFYRLTAFWAGQPGSMLFWATAAVLSGWFWSCTSFAKKNDDSSNLWFWSFFYFIMAFFALLLVCYSNPFIILDPAPADGNGLNPLLQNPGMIIHPPLLFLGYALFIVPTCLCLAQKAGNSEPVIPWFSSCRAWILGGWILLTAGIVIGAWWAYMELGWGGYWAWDPVENASLLPWLTATALLHLLAIERRSGKLAKSSSAMICITLILTFFATWLTRSGIIESVHAFGDGGVGIPLICFVIFLTLLSCSAILPAGTKKIPLAQPISREGGILLSVWVFLALTAIILLATLWPLFSKSGTGLSQGLDPAFYNRVCLPIATLLFCLLAICRIPGWNSSADAKWRGIKSIIILTSFICACAMARTLGFDKILPMIATGAAVAVIMASIIALFSKKLWRNPVKISAFGGHLGIGLVTLGVAFSGPYTQDYELVLKEGQTVQAGEYSVTLNSVKDGAAPGYDFLQANINVAENGVSHSLAPERRIYAKYGTMQFSEVDVISGFKRDIYASLLGMDEEHSVLVKLSIEPLVNWIWIGGAIMCLLPLLGLWRKKILPGTYESSGKHKEKSSRASARFCQ